jgi:hypothetical protein
METCLKRVEGCALLNGPSSRQHGNAETDEAHDHEFYNQQESHTAKRASELLERLPAHLLFQRFPLPL